MSGSTTERTVAERITFVVSLLVLVGILGLAAWSSYRTNGSPAVIEVEAHMDEVRQTPSGYYLPVTVSNTGGLTVQDVTVTGELIIGEEEPETAEITITFLSGGEQEHGNLIFTTDPNEGDFTLGPTSYVNP